MFSEDNLDRSYLIQFIVSLLFAIGLLIYGIRNYINGTLVNYEVSRDLREYTHHIEPVLIASFLLLTISIIGIVMYYKHKNKN